MIARAVRIAALILAALIAIPAQARVTITFWSFEQGGYFPHAFYSLHGTPDRGGPPVKASYGFTAKSVVPAMLMGSVGGKIHETDQQYFDHGTAHFSVQLSDAQFDAVMRMNRDWGPDGNNRYSLNKRNCVHFLAEAMRRSGLRVVEDPKLMKKPKSFANSIAALNSGRITLLNRAGPAYLAATPALTGIAKK